MRGTMLNRFIVEENTMHVISLGAGVQSTTMLLMALAGELEPMPVAAIFADTGWEPAAVYAHLDWLEGVMKAAGMPLYRVTGGDLRADVLAFVSGERPTVGWRMPFHSRNEAGRASMLGRQCTRDYKVRPIRRKIRDLIIEHQAAPVTSWIGISLDEATRMKPSDVRAIIHRWPLIEKRMTRHDCLLWLERHGYPRPPRSACIGCPFHSDQEWRDIKTRTAEWADATEFDDAARQLRGRGEVYLHPQLVPLPMADLSTPQERGQLSLWDQECEGMCGV
jgi:hypothetical protein